MRNTPTDQAAGAVINPARDVRHDSIDSLYYVLGPDRNPGRSATRTLKFYLPRSTETWCDA
jgi:hypothetical protein